MGNPQQMKNYRIKKETYGTKTKYYPQRKILGLFWMNMFGYSDYWDGGYYSFDNAQQELCHYLRKPVVEYLKVDCGENK